MWSRILVALSDEGWITETAQMDSSYVKAHRCSSGAKGGLEARPLALRAVRTTKIHAPVDLLGRPLRLVLTPGNTSEIKGADLLVGETTGMKRLIADRR